MKFREHRGGLKESLATCVELPPTRAALAAHLKPWLEPLRVPVSEAALHIHYYAYDDRIQWDTHIVMLDGFGPVGFTDGPVF